MVQELLPLLPNALTAPQVVTSICALIAGVFLWLTGAAWSRWIVTLVAVALGGALGMMLPRWYLWPINSMALAVLGAVGLGLSAFLVERMWVGLTLGFVLACWATLGTWILCRGADFVWPERADWEIVVMTPPQHVEDVYRRLPESVTTPLPYAAGMAMFSGVALAAMWPRLGRVMCMSVLGTTVVLLFGLTLVATQRPEWLRFVPAPPTSQIGMLAGLTMVGLLAQWPFSGTRLTPRERDEQRVEDATDKKLGQMFAA